MAFLIREGAELIEASKEQEIDLKGMTSDLVKRGCDVVVLGCSYYHVLKLDLQKLMPGVEILEPTEAIVKRLRDLARSV